MTVVKNFKTLSLVVFISTVTFGNAVATRWYLRIEGNDNNHPRVNYTINNRILYEEIDRELADNQYDQDQIKRWVTTLVPDAATLINAHVLGNTYEPRRREILNRRAAIPTTFTPEVQYCPRKTLSLESFINGVPTAYSHVNVQYLSPTGQTTFPIAVPGEGFNERTPFTSITPQPNVIITYWGENANSIFSIFSRPFLGD